MRMNIETGISLLLTALFLGSVPVLTAQEKNKYIREADEAFNTRKYYTAIDLYKKAYVKTDDKAQKAYVIFQQAESYRITNNPRRAEVYYKKAIRTKYPDPIAQFYYAEMLKQQGLYKEAREEFLNYLELAPGDPKGEAGVESCELSIKWKEIPTRYKIENMSPFNERENDYSPSFARKDYNLVYFTSSRDEATGEAVHEGTGENFSDIFETKVDKRGKWSTPVPIDNPGINSIFEDGTPSFNADFSEMYFTRCRKDKKKDLGCQILHTKKEGGKWAEAMILDIAGDSIIIAHPAISPDGQTLYFVSDMKGGQGGKDIWKVQKQGSSWGKPVNMGNSINTERNEMFPYVRSNGTLYFASNGHLGMGGLDIFMATQRGDGSWKITNMRYPINSEGDDFGIAFQGENEKGLFTSNRPDEGRGGDDIYAFSLAPLEFYVKGQIYDEYNEHLVPGADIKLYGDDGTEFKTKADENGAYEFKLKPGVNYSIHATKKDYLKSSEKLTTVGETNNQTYIIDIYLTPTYQSIELEVFYGYNSAELRLESQTALNELVETLNENPNITIELSAHTDNRGNEEYNRKLSQERAQSVVDFLIEKGIAPDRLVAKGYGESKPKEVTELQDKRYPFLNQGDVLDEEFINGLNDELEQEVAHQANRRTEFAVLETDYVPTASEIIESRETREGEEEEGERGIEITDSDTEGKFTGTFMESRERDGAYTYTFIGVSGEQSSFITNFHMEQLSDPDGFENEESIGKRFSLEWEKVNMNGEMVKKIVHLEQAELEEEAPEEGDDEETPNEGNGGEEETEAPANEPEGTNEETPDNP